MKILLTLSIRHLGQRSCSFKILYISGFTGRRWDDETGLYYYRARMYSPALGRFLQTDPIGYADSMNLYTYVKNNPLAWSDPWGLAPNNAEAGNITDVIIALERYINENPGLNNQELIDQLPAHMKENEYNLYGVRYFDTVDGTTIDLLHFAASADYGQWVFGGEVTANSLGFLNEVGQALKGDDSGHPFGGNEDIASNAAGADFGDEYLTNEGRLSNQIINYFLDNYGGITFTKPDYSAHTKKCKSSSSSPSSSSQ